MPTVLRLILCASISLFFNLGLLSNTAQAEPTLEEIDVFFPENGSFSVSLSPDGSSIAVTGLNDQDRRHLHIFDRVSGEEVQKIFLGDVSANWVRWATDERLVLSLRVEYYLQPDSRPKEDDPKAIRENYLKASANRLVAVNSDGTQPAILFSDPQDGIRGAKNLTNIIDMLPNDPNNVIVGAWDRTYSLFKVNIHSGKSKKIETGGPRTVEYDTDTKGRPVVRFDSDRYGKFYDVEFRAPGSRSWKTLGRIKEKDFENFDLIDATDSQDGFFVTTRPEGSDKLGLYRMDLDSLKIGKSVAIHDELDLEGIILDGRERFIAGEFISDRTEYYFRNKKHNNDLKKIKSFFDESSDISLYSLSQDQNIWLFMEVSPQIPGRIYTYDRSTESIKLIVDTAPKVTNLGNFAQTDVIRYRSNDGLPLKGYFTKPKNFNSSTPLIVMPHGGPIARDYYRYNQFVAYLSAEGYAVFQPQFRGSSGYGQDFEKLGYRQWGGLMQDDIASGTRHLIEAGLADQNNICIMGISYGAYAAMINPILHPDLYQCAIAINGPSDLLTMIRADFKRFRPDSTTGKFMIETLGSPMRNKAELINWSPSERAEEMPIPLLLIAGEKDQRVEYEQSEYMRDAMQKAGKDVKYIKFDFADHSLLGRPFEQAIDTQYEKDVYYGQKRAVQEIDAFLKLHLP